MGVLRVRWLAAALLALYAGPVVGQQTQGEDLAALIADAEARNPELVAARKAAEAAVARVRQAGALPDPMLGVGVMNLPVADLSVSRDMMTMTTVQLGEQFPFPGKLELRERMAAFSAEGASWEAERVRQRVVAEVKAAYYRIYFVDRALEVTDRNEALVGDFARLTSAKYGVGTAAQPDVLKAQVERTRLEDQLVALRQQRSSAVARLNALVSRPTDTPLPHTELPEAVRIAALEVGDPEMAFVSAALDEMVAGGAAGVAPGLPSIAELQQVALQNNPMIQAHVRRIAAQQRAVSLAEKAMLPDFNVSVGYSRRPDFGDFFQAMVMVPLPVFSGRKQDQAVLEASATLSEHEARHHAMVNEVNADIASRVAELHRARSQLVLLNEGILPQARASLASATAAYQVGRVDFLALLDSQVKLYQHELDYHRLLSDFATNLAALERLVGKEILP
ncbi:MAG: TolC family protein [Longimicrobiales bacterium]